MRVHLTPVSRNTKTGPIPVSTTSNDTCPDSCPFKGNGCYAEYGPLRLHWEAVLRGERGTAWDAFLTAVRRLPKHQLWRHNQAGDLPGQGDVIDAPALAELARANRDRNGFTYTHKPMTPDNAEAVRAANVAGFTINVSANTLTEADALADLNVAPVVAVVPRGAPAKGTTPAGRRYVVCPAQLDDDMNCARCGLCQRRDTRRPIIAFQAHGTGRKRIDAYLTTHP